MVIFPSDKIVNMKVAEAALTKEEFEIVKILIDKVIDFQNSKIQPNKIG